jgi:hypothetical protein
MCGSKNGLQIWPVLHFLKLGNDFGSPFFESTFEFSHSLSIHPTAAEARRRVTLDR